MTLFSIKALGRNWLCLFLSVTGPGLVGERLVAGADLLPPLPPAAVRAVDFVRDIQPIFAKNCLGCHGPQRQEAAYRLDAKDIALQGGDLGPAIIPGKSAESLLIQFVAGRVPDKVMPRKGERLTAEQVGLLRAWIEQGAAWPESASVKIASKREHWAFKAPTRPPLPPVKNKAWSRNPIDRFILARLEREGLGPSPEADRATLARRLSLDLLGLPPAPQEVDEFLSDRSTNAYAKVVERLLRSPHYGERWGRHWLDAARYADSNGYEKDRARSIWSYRDWVINAFNRDLPFDQFTREQLGGDLLPNATTEQVAATGFLRNSMLNQEGGIEPEQFRIDAMIDRMDAIGKAWLGLTISCAQCHNHKYDPISQKEYYQLFAFLNNDDEPFIEVPTEEQQTQRAQLRERARDLERQAMRAATNLSERLAAWEKSLANDAGVWTVLDPQEVLSNPVKYEKQSDLSLLGGGDVYAEVTAKIWAETQLTNLTGFRLEALLHPNLPYGGPGILGKGTFHLAELTVEAYAAHQPTVPNQLKFKRAVADAEAPGFAVTNAIDGDTSKGGWSNDFGPSRRHDERRAVFECTQPFPGFPGGTKLVFTLYMRGLKEAKMDCATIGRIRLSATTQPGLLTVDPLTAAQRKLLAIPSSQRTPEQTQALFSVFRQHDPGFAVLTKQLDAVYTNWPYASTTLALRQRTEPRATRIFKRGDWQKQAEEVGADVPAVLHAFPAGAPRNRLGFAEWLIARRSPTTARVLVNRIWQAYFGQGLFTTAEDIGTRVEPPSHPELLDWLACEFMERGWSFKEMHRLITSSATYRQSSRVTPALLEKDPYNRLLARGPRFRVEAEIVQDIALAASGLLSPKIGGPSVYPPIPSSVSDQVYGGFSWPESKGTERYRRGLYTFWKRSLPFPALLAFDAPTAETSCARRTRSNTPLQALVTLNEKTYVEAAQAMGLRVLRQGGPDERSRMNYAFRLATGRFPTEGEARSLQGFWEEQYRYFEERTADALSVALSDPKDVPKEVNIHKVAAWVMVSRAILNLDETLTKE
jgi:mono/diheme cytochrome c family protein